jgi:hypothetical protein
MLPLIQEDLSNEYTACYDRRDDASTMLGVLTHLGDRTHV